jgi:hypothetical protein
MPSSEARAIQFLETQSLTSDLLTCIQSALRKWPFGIADNHSSEREQMHYSRHRPHQALQLAA